jgi:hypothetical protein
MSDQRNGNEVSFDLEQRAARAFDASVAELNAETRARLRQARMHALEHETGMTPGLAAARRYAWMPVGVAGALLAAWALWGPQPEHEAELAAAPPGDLEILLAEEDLAVFEELEFYTWLEEQPELATPDQAGDGVG